MAEWTFAKLSNKVVPMVCFSLVACRSEQLFKAFCPGERR